MKSTSAKETTVNAVLINSVGRLVALVATTALLAALLANAQWH
jgi:hypothetical protein